MRTGKRNWILALCAAGFIIFLVGKFSNTTPQSVQASDTRTALERYVSAYSQYTQAQLDRFKSFQAAIVQSDWDSFWMALFRMALGTTVALLGYFGFRMTPIVLDRFRVIKTDHGHVWIGRDGNGDLVARALDAPFQQPAETKSASYTIVKGNQTIEVDRGGNVVDVVDDPADFLEKAIQVNGPRSKELPSHEKMNVSGERWSKMVNDILSGVFDVKPGRVTYCAQYPDLSATYYAVKRGEVPLPAKKKGQK